MSIKQAWNKVKETAQNGIFGIFEPHKLYQVASGWSLQNMRKKFNYLSQNQDRHMMSLALAFSAVNTGMQPAAVHMQTQQQNTYTPDF